ncbi:MAG: AlpA family phage regulatory protein [Alphaproteobacteria bacterium]
MNVQVLPPKGYVRLPVVQAITGVGKSTIWNWVKEGRFPKPIKLSARVTCWSAEALHKWIEDKAEGNHGESRHD